MSAAATYVCRQFVEDVIEREVRLFEQSESEEKIACKLRGVFMP